MPPGSDSTRPLPMDGDSQQLLNPPGAAQQCITNQLPRIAPVMESSPATMTTRTQNKGQSNNENKAATFLK